MRPPGMPQVGGASEMEWMNRLLQLNLFSKKINPKRMDPRRAVFFAYLEQVARKGL